MMRKFCHFQKEAWFTVQSIFGSLNQSCRGSQFLDSLMFSLTMTLPGRCVPLPAANGYSEISLHGTKSAKETAFKCFRQSEKYPRKSILKCHRKAVPWSRFKGEIFSHTSQAQCRQWEGPAGGHKEPARGGPCSERSWALSQKVWN